MQNAILLPTDFSENAWTATRYGAQLAIKYNFALHILHVYSSIGRIMATADFNEELDSFQQNKAELKIDEWAQKINAEFPSLSISRACIQGNLSDIILELIGDNPISFVVMGTNGVSGLTEKLIGSNTFEIIQKSPIGVIAVPHETNIFRLQKIGLLTNFKPDERTLLKTFTSRTGPAMKVSLLHVWENKEHPIEADIAFWKNQLIEETNIENITFNSIEMTNRLDYKNPIPECIAELSKKENVDILLVSYTRKSFFKALFSRSLVKTLTYKIKIPMFFLNAEQT